MKESMKLMLCVGAAAALSALVAGCGAEPTPPARSTTVDIKKRTLDRIDALQKKLAEGQEVGVGPIRDMATALSALKGRMKRVGTREQVEALQEFIDKFQEMAVGALGGTSSDWTPDKDIPPAAAIKIEPGPLKDLLPQVKDLVEKLPTPPEQE